MPNGDSALYDVFLARLLGSFQPDQDQYVMVGDLGCGEGTFGSRAATTYRLG
jgi:16S rRNA G1207 methylase RsmC